MKYIQPETSLDNLNIFCVYVAHEAVQNSVIQALNTKGLHFTKNVLFSIGITPDQTRVYVEFYHGLRFIALNHGKLLHIPSFWRGLFLF